MTWEYDPLTKTYSLVSGGSTNAWCGTRPGQWLAVLSHEGHGADAYSFDTQAWCEARVAEITASRRR